MKQKITICKFSFKFMKTHSNKIGCELVVGVCTTLCLLTGQWVDQIQWNPSIKATLDGGLSKEVACQGGIKNMICKEWCMEMGQNLQL